jgi:hypothetical protein
LLMGALSVAMLGLYWNKQYERHLEIDRTTVDLIELQNKIISSLTSKYHDLEYKFKNLETTVKNSSTR